MTTRRAAWRRSDEVETDEHCTLTLRDSGLALVGTVLEHRLLLSSEAMMRGVNPADVLATILDSVPVPATRAD